MLAFTYLQVLPEFAEFLIPFGKQTEPKHFHFAEFHQRTNLSRLNKGLEIPEIGWSGYGIQLCYNLRDVECSETQPDWPWSIRHCAVHHSFDVRNIRATWIVIKGNRLIEKRIESLANESSPGEFSFRKIESAFAASLTVHLVLCDWSTENWQWYLDHLHDYLQTVSSKTLTDKIGLPSTGTMEKKTNLSRGPHTEAEKASPPQFSFRYLFHKQSEKNGVPAEEKQLSSALKSYTDPVTGLTQPLPPGVDMENSASMANGFTGADNYGQRDFNFEDVQTLQNIEEKVSDAALILKANISILSQLKQYYQRVLKVQGFPKEIPRNCKEDINMFDFRITGVQSALERQENRAEALLRLVVERKAAVNLTLKYNICGNTLLKLMKLYGILEFQNKESHKFFTAQSRTSTNNMELMTRDMKDIARKTKTETVSMKIITLVTLFFLPGTFISVGRIISLVSRLKTRLDGNAAKAFLSRSLVQVNFADSIMII